MLSVFKIIIKNEWLLFVRNRFQIGLLVGVLVLGIASVFNGILLVNSQKETIDDISKIESKEFQEYEEAFKNEVTNSEQKRRYVNASNPAFAWHRHTYNAIFSIHDYAPLSIGQLDLNPFYYRLTGMSLYYQIFENDLANPLKLFVGNFDLSFVIIYLFPLLIITFTYSLYAQEKEQGILPMLKLQTLGVDRIVISQWAFYFILITALALGVTLLGLLCSGNILKADNQFPVFIWCVGVLMYCSFWFGVMLFIIGLKMSSAFNAIISLGIWLVLLIVIPAILNILVTIQYPIDNTPLATISRRNSMDNENDPNEAHQIIQDFFTHDPRYYRPKDSLSNDLAAKAYAGLTSLQDIHNTSHVETYRHQVHQRDLWTKKMNWISPAINIQELFNQAGHTDVCSYQHFQKSIKIFHDQITAFYFEKLFWDKSITQSDYKNRPQFQLIGKKNLGSNLVMDLGKILITSVLFMIIGWLFLRRKHT